MASVRAHINPKVLVWARQQSRYDPDAVARTAGINPDTYEEIEAGNAQPTVKQLWSIADKLKRSVSFFYLEEPPEEPEPLRDFRRLPGIVAGLQSPQLALQIKRARELREVALSLYDDVGEVPPIFDLHASLSDNPEDVAAIIREHLGADIGEQSGIRSSNEILNYWRGLLEEAGVLVLQAPGVSLQEMRGFCISENPLPVVVANVKDRSYRARTFTLLHELAHVVLGESGISDVRMDADRPPEEQKIEVFCNHVAGAVLVPPDILRSNPLVRQRIGSYWSREDIRRLAWHFSVSEEVTLRRLLIYDYVSEVFYQNMREQYKEEYDRIEDELKKKKSTGGPPQDRKKNAYNGNLLTRLALTSYYNERITSVELSRILDVKLKHMPKIERAVMGSNLMFEGA